MPTTSALPGRLLAVSGACVLTLSMAANAIADPIGLAHSIDSKTGLATFNHPDPPAGEKRVEHYLIHSPQLHLQASAMLDLEQYLTSAEPVHGKWVRVSAAEVASTGLLDVTGADYALVKHDGPNLGIFVVYSAAATKGARLDGDADDDDQGDDDQGDDDRHGVAGVGSGSSG